MRVLFWNTHNNEDINHILCELIIENNINIVVLAEYKADMLGLIETLSQQGFIMKEYYTTGCERIKIIGDLDDVVPGLQTDHVSFQIINKNYILCCVHLLSQIYTNNEGARNIEITQIVTAIQKLEKQNDIENTIIVGDLNINPFDHSCIDANFFHSLPFYEVADKRSRIISNQEFKMFYNPMWRFLGDLNKPYGTYYYNGSRVDNIFWNIYDQVIIRPALRNRFVDDSLKIITETESRFLVDDKGHPDNNISDHLPIIFEIKEI